MHQHIFDQRALRAYTITQLQLQFGKLIPEPQGTNLHVSSAWSKGEYKEMDDAIGSLGPIIKDAYV